MAVLIEDAEVDRVIRELASRTGETITQAMKVAAEERLARLAAAPTPRSGSVDRQRLDRIIAEFRAHSIHDPRTDDEIIGYHQLRVPHQVYTDETLKTVKVKGHAHSHNTHFYKKIDGVWKFAGLNPNIRWSEYDFDDVFATGREKLGDEK